MPVEPGSLLYGEYDWLDLIVPIELIEPIEPTDPRARKVSTASAVS